MVKLGNVAPEGMCEATRLRVQRNDSGFTPYKINCNLERSSSGHFIRRWRGRNCLLGRESGGPGPLWGEPGPLPGGLAGLAGAGDEAEGQGCCVLSSVPLAAARGWGPGGVMPGKDGSLDLTSASFLPREASHSASMTSVLSVVK